MFDAFDFTEDDLLANRAGNLSVRQNERVDEYLPIAKKRARFALIVGEGSMLFLFGIAFFAEPNQFLQALPYLSIAAALYLLIFLAFVIVDFNKLRRLDAREVQIAEGTAHLLSKKHRHGRWTAYYVTIDKIRFQIHRDQYKAFHEGARYKIFLLNYPPTHWILSVERK